MSDRDKRHLDTTILEREDKGASKASGVLSKIFRKSLWEVGVNATKWNKLMLQYLDDRRNRIPNNSRAKSSTRGNLTKELSKPNMTWRNFEKGIRFLNPARAVFSLQLSWHNGNTTVHDIELLGAAKTEENPTYMPTMEEMSLLASIGERPDQIPSKPEQLMLADDLVGKGYLKTHIVLDRHGDPQEGYALDIEGYLRLCGEEG